MDANVVAVECVFVCVKGTLDHELSMCKRK